MLPTYPFPGLYSKEYCHECTAMNLAAILLMADASYLW